jgi:glycosyltransferase involved in cell wall biosynthesis
MSYRPCVLVPTYDNPRTIEAVVERVRAHVPDVVVVDDGSGPEGRAACERLAAAGLAHVVHQPSNGGKGAAVKRGFEEAARLGYTHAIQVDADGQHDLDDLPRLLALGQAHPEALILTVPVLDESAPGYRTFGRRISVFWVMVECGFKKVIDDPLCGYRVYPVADALAVRVHGDRMDFDPEIAVRLAWRGLPVINVPSKAIYLTAEEGGVSHFRLFRDNVAISALHTRLCIEKAFGVIFGWLRTPTRRLELPEETSG